MPSCHTTSHIQTHLAWINPLFMGITRLESIDNDSQHPRKLHYSRLCCKMKRKLIPFIIGCQEIKAIFTYGLNISEASARVPGIPALFYTFFYGLPVMYSEAELCLKTREHLEWLHNHNVFLASVSSQFICWHNRYLHWPETSFDCDWIVLERFDCEAQRQCLRLISGIKHVCSGRFNKRVFKVMFWGYSEQAFRTVGTWRNMEIYHNWLFLSSKT